MPLSFGTTPSQVSLFRHISDPKQVSQDKLRELKFKSAKKPKERANSTLSYGGRQSVYARSEAPKSYANKGAERERVESESYVEQDREEEEEVHQQHDNPKEENEEEDAAINSHETGEHAPSYEDEKSQVQSLIDQEVDREKEHFLAELHKYRGQTTRDFSMRDSLTDIQFEYDRLKSPENAANVVRIMGIVLQVVVYAVQWGNGKFGPLLKLDNGDTSWAMQTAESISNRDYDNVLEKLYRKHWRKGSMSPEAELGMMLVGSAGVFHFQTHVNEKLTKRSGRDESGNGGSKAGGGGFNLMDLVGPVMGLMSGGGSGGSGGSGGGSGGSPKPAVPPPFMGMNPFTMNGNSASVDPPPKRFDFVSGKPQSGASQVAAAAVPVVAPPPPSQGMIEMEQQFAKRQQEMFSRMDEVTRRADEQMRASQARQLDLERQLQQTQMKLHQVSQQAMQQQQLHAFQQQQQDFQKRQTAPQQPAMQPQRFLPPPNRLQQQQPSLQQQQSLQLRGPQPELTIVEETSPPLSPRDDDSDEETKFDVKEVMVTERQKRKKNAVELEIDELSIAL